MLLLRGLIGVILRRIRLQQGRTLREVARSARVSAAYLSEIERGQKEASSEVLAALCHALGLTLSDLLDEALEDLRRLEPEPAPQIRLCAGAAGTGRVRTAGRQARARLTVATAPPGRARAFRQAGVRGSTGSGHRRPDRVVVGPTFAPAG
ncbi:helix-turn-helix domain-containing protein [Frankia sp. CiP3]|uniref:helix-turn-helix domain-containing protein n=1 Tax=Frankia sp. CiP3 TaxID=2880971 RepID=UPI001EF51C69